MHTGMVFNIVRAQEFHKPPGTITSHKTTGLLYEVVSCIMNNFWDCLISYLPHSHKVEATAAVMVTDQVHLPSLDWKIVSLPDQETPPVITYLDQHIPASVNMRVPMGITVKDMIMDDQSHWKSIGRAATRSVSCHDHHSAILATHRTIEFLNHNHRLELQASKEREHMTAKEERNLSAASIDPVAASFGTLKRFLASHPNINTNIREFQKDCLKHWHASYDVVDKLFWAPICPR